MFNMIHFHLYILMNLITSENHLENKLWLFISTRWVYLYLEFYLAVLKKLKFKQIKGLTYVNSELIFSERVLYIGSFFQFLVGHAVT